MMADRPCKVCGKQCGRGCQTCSIACARSLNRRPESKCKQCGTLFQPKGTGRITFCGRDCSFAHKRENAKGEQKAPRVPIVCRVCGGLFVGLMFAKDCSVACRKQSTRIAAMRSKPRLTKPRTSCLHCGGPINRTRYVRLYCSNKCCKMACEKRYNQANGYYHRIKARVHSSVGCERFHPNEVFERDGWRCQICRKPVDKTKKHPHPKAPTIDHIVPVSKGGKHSMSNVQCAHSRCNSLRRDVGEAQLRLFC